MTELQTAELIGRVENLTAAVERLLQVMPQTQRTWLSPGELAQLAGVTNRAIAKWRTEGVFHEGSLRPAGHSFQYHRERALADIENRRQGR